MILKYNFLFRASLLLTICVTVLGCATRTHNRLGSKVADSQGQGIDYVFEYMKPGSLWKLRKNRDEVSKAYVGLSEQEKLTLSEQLNQAYMEQRNLNVRDASLESLFSDPKVANYNEYVQTRLMLPDFDFWKKYLSACAEHGVKLNFGRLYADTIREMPEKVELLTQAGALYGDAVKVVESRDVLPPRRCLASIVSFGNTLFNDESQLSKDPASDLKVEHIAESYERFFATNREFYYSSKPEEGYTFSKLKVILNSLQEYLRDSRPVYSGKAVRAVALGGSLVVGAGNDPESDLDLLFLAEDNLVIQPQHTFADGVASGLSVEEIEKRYLNINAVLRLGHLTDSKESLTGVLSRNLEVSEPMTVNIDNFVIESAGFFGKVQSVVVLIYPEKFEILYFTRLGSETFAKSYVNDDSKNWFLRLPLNFID